MHCETIRITSDRTDDNPLGYIVINAEDFDPAKHQKFEDDKAPAAETKPDGRRGRRAAQESAE